MSVATLNTLLEKATDPDKVCTWWGGMGRIGGEERREWAQPCLQPVGPDLTD